MPATPCWQHMKCGIEKDCPAYPDHGFDCWNVEGTLCRGQRQGNYDSKVVGCRSLCDYYQGIMMGTIKIT
jgi:methyl-accepting chemotaxis protein